MYNRGVKMTIQQLRYAIAIAETGSLNKASEVLYVSQPSLTNAVRELEKEFFFYEWAPEEEGRIPIRLVTGWGTKPEEVETFLTRLAVLLRA